MKKNKLPQKPKKLPFRRFVHVLDNGVIDQESMSKSKPTGDKWIEVVDKQDLDIIGLGIHRLRYENGHLKEKTRVRLSVGGFQFPADGKTKCAIGIRGRDLPDDQEVQIKINGEKYSIVKYDDLLLISDQPGTYIIKLADPYCYASPNELQIDSVEPIEE